MTTFILICLIFLIAGFIQGISGFGSALFAMPLLSLFIDLKVAVPLCAFNGLTITTYLAFKLRKYVDYKKILPLLISSIPGIYIGVILLKSIDFSVLKIFLGLLISLYSIYSLIFTPQTKLINKLWLYIIGFSSGFVGSLFGVSGLPVIIYVTLTDWAKDVIKATISVFLCFSTIITIIVLLLNNLITPIVLNYFLLSIIPVVLGTYLGSKLYHKFNRHHYLKLLFIILIPLGIMLVF